MKLVNSETKKLVTLELNGVEIERVIGAWRTLEKLIESEDQELSTVETTAISTAMSVLGLLA